MTINKEIQHLYWRAGFGLGPKQFEISKGKSRKEMVQWLFDEAALDHQRLSNDFEVIVDNYKKAEKEERKMMRKMDKKNLYGFTQEWILRMAGGEYSDLLDRMSLFWHGHFACGTKKTAYATNQLYTIRKNALGNFRALILGIAKDPAMIAYLNNKQNKKKSPNENFARELMELFTIGRGNYSEKDIKEAARAFTGWSSSNGRFEFKERQHDFETKTFMGESGNLNGDDIIDIILKQKETSIFIARKVYKYFVNEKVVESQVVELSNVFYQTNYDVKAMMHFLFNADWFYEEKNIGTKIKSPVELLAGIVRITKANFEDTKALWYVQKALGQNLFNPPNVAGWPGGKSWIDNSTLMLRLNLSSALFLASDLDLQIKNELEDDVAKPVLKKLRASANINPTLLMFNNISDGGLIASCANFLLQNVSSKSISIVDQFVSKNSRDDYIKSILLRIMSLPEYQLC